MDSHPLIDLSEAAIFHKEKNQPPVLTGVNMTIYPGELAYITGPVGSGKSTLLKTVYGELPLRAGQGRVCGYNLRTLRRSGIPGLRRKIGIIFQEYNLLNEHNVYENLEFALRATDWKDRKKIHNRIQQVLDMVGMTDKAYQMPQRISGGERQRVCVARALLNNPMLIIADEPTGNLDPIAASDIISLLHQIAAGGCGVLLSTHNIDIIRKFPARTSHCAAGMLSPVDMEQFMGV